jgi:hypothetical protein
MIYMSLTSTVIMNLIINILCQHRRMYVSEGCGLDVSGGLRPTS